MCDYVGDCPVARRNSFNFQASSQVSTKVVAFVTAPHFLFETFQFENMKVTIHFLNFFFFCEMMWDN
jgi:hypothetical protein